MTTQLRYENDDGDLFTNKSTMLANFEKWIKLATDNKINSRNSWNFGLIDYFHDLNVLKDSEDNINFQKASATLDGCIKIYSSRVDSVSTETSKLLSGLAQKRKEKQEGNGEGDNEGGDDQSSKDKNSDDIQIDPLTGLPIDMDDDGTNTRRRVYNRMVETTLVDFNVIKLKALDKELNIDPLFKKALVDFDEGGAKSLLLNSLHTNSSGRVVFDAAIKDNNFLIEAKNDVDEDDKVITDELNTIVKKIKNTNTNTDLNNNEDEDGNSKDEMAESEQHHNNEDANHVLTINQPFDTTITVDDDILELGMEFINFDNLVKCEISPAIHQLRTVVDDISKAKDFIEGVNNKTKYFLSEEELNEALIDEGSIVDEENFDNQEQDFNDLGDVDVDMNTDDQNNNLSANEASMMEHGSLNDIDNTSGIMNGIFEKDLMSYFDTNLRQSWRGRDHWKIRILKNILSDKVNTTTSNDQKSLNTKSNPDDIDATTNESKKNKKIQEEIDFFEVDDTLEDEIFTTKPRKLIEIPLKYRINESHFLLPDDYHFSTETLTSLFIKPRQKMSLFRNNYRKSHSRQFSNHFDEVESKNQDGVPELADEQFWANNYEQQENIASENANNDNEIREVELNNPFEDDNGIDFNQAFDDDNDMIIDDMNEETKDSKATDDPQVNSMLSQLQNNKVNYSRVTKKVDIKRLKNNIWKSINILLDNFRASNPKISDNEKIELRFVDIAKEITPMYHKDTLSEISTSFCFICLLHLCNDYGLTLKNTELFEDLIVVCNYN
ncbi:hypothetical protein TPHA_0K00620 [Tetrapisispora phaffii CBS 4417]|uniref:Condensin complex subunit 2 n=1 Tax=Tetrapisispora phaffii (strain ATCC 24235 / CBS 4417 / NBRC 1672 / NRRL Y-8282 / UCD 70-5) TaxID=1071381 RepID=G8BZ68_TETPH|nr:hypothetical protein TPHA_0K00620 [Tetrapisispora phaffii CBS 4417]CCE65196.1 hypothetical protein TPHA_0K00620 [Tetrapisispora phaffii CBS 4417]